MPGFSALTPNITVNTESGQLRTELLNTFSRLDGQLRNAPFKLYSQLGPVGNVGTGETTLMNMVVNFGTLQLNGQSLYVLVAGKTNSNANNKTLKLKFGATTVFTSGALASNNIDWTLQAEIIRNGGSAQITWAQFLRNGSSPIVTTSTATESLAVNTTLSITGQGTASDDISAYSLKVLLLN